MTRLHTTPSGQNQYNFINIATSVKLRNPGVNMVS
nr:hypothetical protein MACL_00000728 [Theileria orientalis]